MTVKRQRASAVRLWGAPTLGPDEWTAYVPSGERQVEDPWLLTTGTFRAPEPMEWETVSHPEPELLWSGTGNVTVEAAGHVWLVPPALGIWLPAGMPHRVKASAGTVTYATFLNPGLTTSVSPTVTGIPMSRLLREILLHNQREEMPDEARLRLQRVGVDLVRPVQAASLDIPLPKTPELRSVADRIIADPADDRTTEEWARELGLSGRTLMRWFQRDTGVSLTQWRILVRVRRALIDIAAGTPVVAVSRRLGYANPSTFIDLFRQVTGHTPAAYFRSVSGLDDAAPLSAVPRPTVS
ncbi:helix-turn-helix domain-containing protein [Streptomyces sp. SID4919]|uniref:AraC family transcriptional regulator n=1 Tax=unclassified Streptomyces TaxID=2593676 RepID=UPI0008237A70|nr:MULTISPECIES: AraC family transcriptional regulator [unclassified Streptomyces]MYY12361.1 helix-turn-helix domain-containing protein [Streptomyces sp. SID4919]SCK54044.1 AraC-type DNA-binding protein [Streptomyces sp. AmelKG-E11A]